MTDGCVHIAESVGSRCELVANSCTHRRRRRDATRQFRRVGIVYWASRESETLLLASHAAGRKDDQQIGEFTDGEYCAAEYQSERSADVTQQSQHRVRFFSLDVRVLQLREEYLRATSTCRVKLQFWQNEYRCRPVARIFLGGGRVHSLPFPSLPVPIASPPP